jgi:enoyl-CoA hydratase/carnithine racemase
MKTDKIIYEQKESVGFITLNNPAKMNCMGFELLHGLNDTVEEIKTNPDVKVVVFQGAGDRAFSTGADLKEFRALSADDLKKWIVFGNEIFNKIETLNKPTIAFINGYALGGGLELALASDFRIGTQTAVLGSPELEHGWLPGWGGITRLRRLLGEIKAKEIVMLNQKLNAEESLKLGLLNRIDDENKEQLNFFTHHLRNLKPQVFELAKTALQDENRTTFGTDIQFDVLAAQIALLHS